MAQMANVSATGQPINRPLWWDFPEDHATWDIQTSFMFGDKCVCLLAFRLHHRDTCACLFANALALVCGPSYYALQQLWVAVTLDFPDLLFLCLLGVSAWLHFTPLRTCAYQHPSPHPPPPALVSRVIMCPALQVLGVPRHSGQGGYLGLLPSQAPKR